MIGRREGIPPAKAAREFMPVSCRCQSSLFTLLSRRPFRISIRLMLKLTFDFERRFSSTIRVSTRNKSIDRELLVRLLTPAAYEFNP